MCYVYILECSDSSLYTGYAVDLKKRLKMHNEKKGAKYTRGRTPVVIRYFEIMCSKEEALSREHEIKKLSRLKKIELINKQKPEKLKQMEDLWIIKN